MTHSQSSLRLSGSFPRSGAGPCSMSGISTHCARTVWRQLGGKGAPLSKVIDGRDAPQCPAPAISSPAAHFCPTHE